jgi:hypothetical protein
MRKKKGKNISLLLHKHSIPLAPGYGSCCCEENINAFSTLFSMAGKHLPAFLCGLALRLATEQDKKCGRCKSKVLAKMFYIRLTSSLKPTLEFSLSSFNFCTKPWLILSCISVP